jgi:hypothetical protein
MTSDKSININILKLFMRQSLSLQRDGTTEKPLFAVRGQGVRRIRYVVFTLLPIRILVSYGRCTMAVRLSKANQRSHLHTCRQQRRRESRVLSVENVFNGEPKVLKTPTSMFMSAQSGPPRTQKHGVE